jgi:dTMP kinase
MTALKETTLEGFKPDFTLYLDLDPRVGLERARGRGELDRIEKMNIEFFDRTRGKYLELAHQDDSVAIINADQDIELVGHDIKSALLAWLGENS